MSELVGFAIDVVSSGVLGRMNIEGVCRVGLDDWMSGLDGWLTDCCSVSQWE